MLGFHMSQLALRKLFGTDDIIWEQMNISDENLTNEVEPGDRLIHFSGIAHGMSTAHIYRTLVTVRITKNEDNAWATKYVDVYCFHPKNGIDGWKYKHFETEVPPFTQFVCGDLENGLPVRIAP